MNYLALFDVFRKGEAVLDPATWKNRYALGVAVSALLVAVNHAYPLGIDQSTADAFGVVGAFVFSMLSHYTTSDKVGLLPAKPVPVSDGQADMRGSA